MANLVWALARASYASPRTNALLAVVCNHAAEVVQEFQPAEMSRLLHSLSMLSFYNRNLFQLADTIILERIQEYLPEDLALLATAFVSIALHLSKTKLPTSAFLIHLTAHSRSAHHDQKP